MDQLQIDRVDEGKDENGKYKAGYTLVQVGNENPYLSLGLHLIGKKKGRKRRRNQIEETDAHEHHDIDDGNNEAD